MTRKLSVLPATNAIMNTGKLARCTNKRHSTVKLVVTLHAHSTGCYTDSEYATQIPNMLRDVLYNKYLAQGVPVLKISDPNPIFQIAPLPTHPLRHIAYYNDIHKQNLNIHTVNYIHMWFYLCMNIINILMILNLC